MPLDGRRCHLFPRVHDGLDHPGALGGLYFGQFPGLGFGCNCNHFVRRQGFNHCCRGDELGAIGLTPPPLLLAILAKTAVFPPVESQVADFRQGQSDLHKGLLATRNHLLQFSQPLIVPQQRYRFVILHIGSFLSWVQG